MNALNKTVLLELSKALDDVESSEGVRAAVLTGCGDKAFVAGADIAAMKNLTPAEAGVLFEPRSPRHG